MSKSLDSRDNPTWVMKLVNSVTQQSRLRDEIVAFLIFTCAVILSLPFVGLANGTGMALVVSGFEEAVGKAAIAIPFAVSILAVEIWRAGDQTERLRRLAGGAISGVAIIGLLEMAARDQPRDNAGGFIGDLIVYALDASIGEVGSGLLLFAIGVAGVSLVTGTDIDTLRWSWARIWYVDQDDFDSNEFPHSTEWLVDEAPNPSSTDSYANVPDWTQEDELAEQDEVSRPVINVNRPDTASDEIRKAVGMAVPEEDRTVDPDAEPGWTLPPIDLMTSYESADPDQVGLEAKARRIEDTLSSFKVEAVVREIFPGPAVTLFAVEPGTGVKVSKITSLQNDLALALAAPSIRIEAPVPGMARVGIEIPNAEISTVGMRDMLESIEVRESKAKLPMALGADVNGRTVIADLTRMPHILIAGATGSGKSVCINSIIATFLCRKTPDELQMLLIDPKMVELVGYKNIPHLKGPIVTEMDKVVSALRTVLHEMERRYQMFADIGVRNIDGYNMRLEDDESLERLPHLVVIIDELADLMMTTPDEVETLLARLCQMARATGIHMIIATQRPSVDVLTGLIKANVQARIAFAVTSVTDSRVILDISGAERLLGRGDMLYLAPDAARPKRIQGSFIDDDDLGRIVTFWRKQMVDNEFELEWPDFQEAQEVEDEDDPLRERAVDIVRSQGAASASMLQRRLRIGYNRAARIIESMEDEGLIGPADGPRSRTVLMDTEEQDD